MTEREIQDLLRNMRDEPVPADSLARVRMGVRIGMDRRIGQRKWWKFAVPLAIAGCIVAGFLLIRPAKAPVRTVEPAPLEIARMETPPEIPVRTAPRPAPKPRRTRPRPRPVEAVPVLIRIETPDPDVVILFVN